MKTLFDTVAEFISGDWGDETESASAPQSCYCIRAADVVPIEKHDYSTLPLRFVSNNSFAQRQLIKGDIVIEKSGGSPTQSTGRVVYISQSLLSAKRNIICSNFCTAIRMKPEWNPYFVYQYWRQVYSTGVFFNYEGKTSGLKNLQLEVALKSIPIPEIDLPTQLRIAGVLGSIDEKIELNRKKIAELEALAKTIYDYWFVQFDFPDKNGKPYKSSGGKMVWNDQLKREVPEGWDVVPLGELSNSEVVRVKTCDDVMPYVTTENLRPNMGGYACDERDVTTIVGGHYFSKNDILVSNIRPYFQKIWYSDTHGVASSDVIKFHSKDNSALLYFTLARPNFFDYVMKGAKGSKMPRGDKAHIARYVISWGNCSLRGKVASLFQSVLERCNLLEKEISYWERQRDALLPLLMNGQVEVVG